MSVADQVYLRDRKGGLLGPLEASTLEVLYCADVVDDKTPVSTDGRSFIPLERNPELIGRARSAREKLSEGAHPWDSGPLGVADDLLDEGEAELLLAEEKSEVPTEPPPPPTKAPAPAPPPPAARRPASPVAAPPAAARPSRPAPAATPAAPPRPAPSPAPAPRAARPSVPPPPGLSPGAADASAGLSLSRHPAARLLFDHAIEGSTGRLRFATDFGSIDCCFVDGEIVSIETDMDLLALDQFLVNKGAVSEDAVAKARRKMPGAELGHALIGLGLIPPHVYMDALGRWARTTLSWIVALEEGRAEFIQEDLVRPAVPAGLERFASLVQAIREGVQRDQIHAALAPHRDSPLIPSQLSGVELDQLKLDPRELRVLRSVDGAHTVASLMESVRGSEHALLAQRALFIGYVSRFLVAGEARGKTGAHAIPAADTTPESVPPAPPPRAPAPAPAPAPPRAAPRSPLTPPSAAEKPAPRRSPLTPPQAASAPSAVVAASEKKPATPPAKPAAPPNDAYEALRLRKEFEVWQAQDPFKVLGVAPSNNDQEVRQKFMALAKKYHPDAAPMGTGDEVLAIRQEIFAFLQHMYDQIKTEAQRAEFKLLVDEGLKSRAEEQELVRAILDAESCFLKAEAMVKSRRWKDALSSLDEGLALKRDDKEMLIYKAYVEAMIDGAYPKAIRRITELLGKDENLLSAFLFLARLHKAASDMDAAVRMFKRVQQIDPHNNEAASEIRLTNMRKEKEKKKGKWF